MHRLIISALTAIKMAYIKYALWKPLIKKTHRPQATQEKLLRGIIQKNKNTTFGKDHHFNEINTYQDFRSRVPVCEYEDLRQYIENQETDQFPHLNVDHPCMYAQTSGTTGKPKNIPILKSTIQQYQKSQHIVAYAIYTDIPRAYDGKVLAITSPAVEGVMASGIEYGAMSGLIYQSMPSLMKAKYVLPAEVFTIRDYQEKYYEIAKRALAEQNITMIATANPSTLIKIDQVINQDPEKIIADIRLMNKQRAEHLSDLFAVHGELMFRDLWPNLKSIITWTGGNCAMQIPKLQKRMPKSARFVELGYLASEFRGGITLDVINNHQIPTLHENFFEFVEKDNWENGLLKFLQLHEIEPNKLYYIFATTQSGLYRYNINDLVEVTGKINQTPTIQFVQKGKGVTNLTGEKLYEGQLIQGVWELLNESDIDIPFFKMLGDCQDLRYTMYIEQDNIDVIELERRLSKTNIEFRDKRKSGRLKPTRLINLKNGTGEAYKQHCLANGQREGQFKMIYLQHSHECNFNFESHRKHPAHTTP